MRGLPISSSLILNNIFTDITNQITFPSVELPSVTPEAILAVSTVLLVGALAYKALSQPKPTPKLELNISFGPNGLQIRCNKEFGEIFKEILKVIAERQSRFPHYSFQSIQKPVFFLPQISY